jgi:protein SCO1/2
VSTRRLHIAILGGALLLAACKERGPIEMLPAPATPALQHYWKIPDFTLTERSGQPLRLADLLGKVWVGDFFYTSCPGPCPVMSSRLGEVQKAMGSAPDVRLVSISVDPKTDTADVLKGYAERYKAGAHWFFCTGEKDVIATLAHDGFKLAIADAPTNSTEGPVTHSTRLVLVDKTGTVRGFYDGTTEEGVQALLVDLRRLLDEK